MYRHNKQDQEVAEKLPGKQQRPAAGGQNNSSMRSHDQAYSNLTLIQLAAKNPSTPHELQVALDEGGEMRQKDDPSCPFADAGTHFEESIPTAPSPLAAQRNTREYESSNHVADLTPASTVTFPNPSPLTTSSSSANSVSVQPLRPKAASNIAALRSQSFSPSQDRPVHVQETMHAPFHPTESASTVAPLGPKAASNIAALRSQSFSPSQDRPVHVQETMHAHSPHTTSTATVATPTQAAMLATPTKTKASKAHYLSKSGSIKDRFLSSPKFSKALKDIPPTMGRSHIPPGPVVLEALPPASEKTLGAFPDSPDVVPVTATVAASPSVVPVYSTPAASSENLPTFIEPTHPSAGAVPVQDSNAVVPAYSTPILTHSDLPITGAPVQTVSAASPPAAKESTSTSKSTIATAAAAVATAAAGVLKKLSDHPEPPKAGQAPDASAVVTHGVKETATTLAVPVANTAALPVKLSTAAALKTPKKDLSLYDEEESTYPRGDEAAKLENPAHPAVIEDVIEVKKLPKEFHSTAAALKTPKKNLSLYDEEESTYPRGDEAAKLENPAHPAVIEDVIEVKKLPKEFHSTAAALKTPKKDLSLYDEEESTYPRGDEAAKLENPAHPAVIEDVIEAKMPPKEFHSTAAALKTPKKDLSLYDEEESTYPRGDEAAKLENPAHPAVIEDVIEVKKLPKEFHSTAAALKTPKKDLSLYDEEESTYPRGDEAAKLENPAHPAVIEDVIEVKKLPKEFHSTAAALKTPKKDLSLYDEEESTYPRGDETAMHENPAHPIVVDNIGEVKQLPKEAVATLAIPAVMAVTMPEQHSTSATLKLPQKNLSLYDEEESTYPRGDEAAQHENPAHPPSVEDIMVAKIAGTEELPLSETPIDGDRQESHSSMKDKVKEALGGFHMPTLGRKKDKMDADVETTATTTTPSKTQIKPAVAVAVAAPVAAGIAATLRDTSDDEPFIEPPHHRLTSAPAVMTEPFYLKPAAPLIDEEKSTSISARKLEPLSVLPPTGSVMVTDKATTTQPAHPLHEVTSHPHVAVAEPDTIAAAAAVPAEATTIVPRETAETGTSTHDPTIATDQHSTVTGTLVNAAASVVPVPVTPVVAASTTSTQVPSTATHSTPEGNSFKTKASLVAAAVAAPLIAAKSKITHHHDDSVAPETITIATPTTTAHPTAATPHITTEASHASTTVPHATATPTSKASHMAATVAAPFVAVKEKLTGHHHGNTATHEVTPSTATTAAMPVSGVHPSRTSEELPKEQTIVERKVIGKVSDDLASKVPHNDNEEVIMVESKTTKTTTFPPTHTHVYEPAHATMPHKPDEDIVMKEATALTPPTDVEPSNVPTATADTHVVKPVIETHITKAPETVAAAVPVTAAAVDAIIDPVDKDRMMATSVATENTFAGEIPQTTTSTIPYEDDEDAVILQTTTTTTTEVTPAVDVKGKGKHEDHLPAVATAPIVDAELTEPIVVAEATPEPVVEVNEPETKEAMKERKKKEKQAKKAEAKMNKVPLKTKFKKFRRRSLAAAATAAVRYEDRMPMRTKPVLRIHEHDVKKPSPPAVAPPLLTMTEDDVEKPEIPELAPLIFTVTEDDIVKPYPVLTKRPVLTVFESDVEYPSALDAPYPVIPYVAPKLVSTSARKVASARRPTIPAQPVRGKDIKFPKVVIPRYKAAKMLKLKKKTKVAATTAAVVPVTEAVETQVVEPIKPVAILEVPEPVVETFTTRVVEPVVVRKPTPVVVETVITQVVDAPKIAEPPEPAVVAVPKVVEAPTPVIVTEAPKVADVLKPVAVAAVAKEVVEEVPKPVIVEPPPKPVLVEAPKAKPVIIDTPKPVEVPKSVVVPTPIPKPVPTPAPVVVPTISTNVETVIPDGYSGAVPRIAADESLIWVKKVSTKNVYYSSEDEDELDEFGYRKDRDVSRYIAPPNKTAVHGGRGTVAARGVDNKQADYTLANRANSGFVNSSQPQQRTMANGGYNTQPRQSAL